MPEKELDYEYPNRSCKIKNKSQILWRVLLCINLNKNRLIGNIAIIAGIPILKKKYL